VSRCQARDLESTGCRMREDVVRMCMHMSLQSCHAKDALHSIRTSFTYRRLLIAVSLHSAAFTLSTALCIASPCSQT
jgi:nitrite reductase/ring-hydroxylating ferredoxin subunit